MHSKTRLDSLVLSHCPQRTNAKRWDPPPRVRATRRNDVRFIFYSEIISVLFLIDVLHVVGPSVLFLPTLRLSNVLEPTRESWLRRNIGQVIIHTALYFLAWALVLVLEFELERTQLVIDRLNPNKTRMDSQQQ